MPRNNTVSLRTILSSPIPSKSSARLNVPVLVAIGAAVGVGATVGVGVTVGVGGTGVAVGAGVDVGVGVSGTGVGGIGVAVDVGIGTDVAVGVEGTGVYLSRLSTHPVAATRTNTSVNSADLNTNSLFKEISRAAAVIILLLLVDCREVATM